MNESTEVQKESSVVSKSTEGINENQPQYESWMLVLGLVISLVILKTFIYIKDGKRSGK